MGRPRTYTRDEVLRKATDLFARKGYEGAHLQELVDVTGLNRFSLYKEFGGKEGLFQAALEGYLGQLAALSAALQRDPAGLANVRAFYAALLAEDFPHGCLAVNTIREKHVLPAHVYATIERFAAETERSLLRNLRGAEQRGELAPGTDAEGLAQFLTALNMGVMSYAIVAPDPACRARIYGVVESVLR
ncbi:MAG: TetR/AcrR family transcriptional regulator [Planctomycetes bacterium]|nr:TetR/AcrR family transcriptional regulator [Planctomycetota bacterium]